MTVILDFLGEEHSACTSQDWNTELAGMDEPQLSCILLGQVDGRGGAARLLKQLSAQFERLPLLLLDDHDTGTWPEELRRRVLALGARWQVQGLPARLRDLAALYGVSALLPA